MEWSPSGAIGSLCIELSSNANRVWVDLCDAVESAVDF